MMRKEWSVLAIGMLGRLEGQARRAVQLADDHALGPVNDKGALGSHEGQFAHENFFFLGGLFLLEQESHVQRRAIGNAFPQAFQPVVPRLADFVAMEPEDAFAIVAFNWKDFGKDGLQAGVFPLGGRSVALQEIPVGISLQLDQVGRRDDLLDLPECDAFCCFKWHD